MESVQEDVVMEDEQDAVEAVEKRMRGNNK